MGTVLIVADAERIGELAEALTGHPARVLSSAGGDDTVDLFAEHKPHVVVVTATLETGDAKSLVDALRDMVPRAEVAIVVVGDDTGPIRTALDAGELAPDKFVTRPLSAKALTYAVSTAFDAVALVRRGSGSATSAAPAHVDDDPTSSQRASMRARWAAIADSFVGPVPTDGDGDGDGAGDDDDAEIIVTSAAEPAPLPPPVGRAEVAPPQAWRPGTTAEIDPPTREPTMIIRDPEPTTPEVHPSDVVAPPVTRSQSRWVDPMPLAALLDTRGGTPAPRWPSSGAADADDLGDLDEDLRTDRRAGRLEVHTSGPHLGDDDDLGHELDDAHDRPTPIPPPFPAPAPPVQTIPGAASPPTSRAPAPVSPPSLGSSSAPGPTSAAASGPAAEGGRDFARQLRAKMSMMAQRLFQGGGGGADPAQPPAVDIGPRHDHHTEIDLASLGEELALGGGVTEIESRQAPKPVVEVATSPGSWDTSVRERGIPDHGELMRGVSDAAMLLAKMFAQSSTGRIAFRRDDIEKVVLFDQGRPVFASSSEPRDRMGELLVREGKITAAQYERCQSIVAESGRRMGEILVDFGYLKRRELLPAVRRHVEDIVYSLFGWDRGTYRISLDETPSAERIRLSRHPAALILEGIRRKLDRTTLERLLGPPSTVVEVRDRERLGGIINTGDLATEERAALAAFDAQSDLATVARTAGVDLADVLPIAWGLCALGLATARRTDTEVPDETSALVGETDLAIDRERVRARWQLVTEADYFALLGVRRDATTFEIRRAYQSARRDFALDAFPADLRRELAQELDDIAHVLDEAFRVLRDDRLRMTYLSNLFE